MVDNPSVIKNKFNNLVSKNSLFLDIFKMAKEKKIITRYDLIETFGITKTTAFEYLDRLLDLHILKKSCLENTRELLNTKSRGRPKTLWNINEEVAVILS